LCRTESSQSLDVYTAIRVFMASGIQGYRRETWLALGVGGLESEVVHDRDGLVDIIETGRVVTNPPARHDDVRPALPPSTR
jgi:hypothetical protein